MFADFIMNQIYETIMYDRTQHNLLLKLFIIIRYLRNIIY